MSATEPLLARRAAAGLATALWLVATQAFAQPVGAPPATAPRINIDALPQPVTRTPIDLSALAQGYAAQADTAAGPQALARGPGLFVFVSLSMPRPTLLRLFEQASRARALVVLRGLANGSLRDTASQVQSLLDGHAVAVQIDPQAFDRFSIAEVPSFVLVRDGTRPASCASGTCAPPEAYLQVAGDVSLDYALQHMQRAAPGFSAEATGFLQRLQPPARPQPRSPGRP